MPEFNPLKLLTDYDSKLGRLVPDVVQDFVSTGIDNAKLLKASIVGNNDTNYNRIDQFRPKNEYPRREPIKIMGIEYSAPRIVKNEYKDTLARAYADNPDLVPGFLEAVIMKESEMGTKGQDTPGNAGKLGWIAQFKNSAEAALKEENIPYNLETEDGVIKAMTDYLKLRAKKLGVSDPTELYMRGYYGRPNAHNDRKIFQHYFDTYKTMYE